MVNEDPCWDGYKMVGKKKKNGKEVPNCVPESKSMSRRTISEDRSPFEGPLDKYAKYGKMPVNERPSVVQLISMMRKDSDLKIPSVLKPNETVSLDRAIRSYDGKKHPSYRTAAAVIGENLKAAHPELENNINNYDILKRNPKEAYTTTRAYAKRVARALDRHDDPDAKDKDGPHPTKGLSKADRDRIKAIDRGVYSDMYQTITNSETGNDVYVKTVLGYGSSHPDYDKAYAMIGGDPSATKRLGGPGSTKDIEKKKKSDDEKDREEKTRSIHKKARGKKQEEGHRIRSHLDQDERNDKTYPTDHGSPSYGSARISEEPDAPGKKKADDPFDDWHDDIQKKWDKWEKTGKTENIRLSDMISEEDRDYKQEYEKYHSKPEQRKRRSDRNKSRRKMEKMGKVKKGDGKDVHHKNHNTSDMSSDNLAAVPKSKNRAKNRKS